MSEAEKVQAGARLKRMPSVEPEIRVMEKVKFDDAIKSILEGKVRIMVAKPFSVPKDDGS